MYLDMLLEEGSTATSTLLGGKCVHHWLLSPPNGDAQIPAVCKRCGEQTMFVVSSAITPQKLTCPSCFKGVLRPRQDSLMGGFYKCDRCKREFN